MVIQEVINDIEYDKMDESELSFIISMYLKNHCRKTQKHIDMIEYKKFREALKTLLGMFSN